MTAPTEQPAPGPRSFVIVGRRWSQRDGWARYVVDARPDDDLEAIRERAASLHRGAARCGRPRDTYEVAELLTEAGRQQLRHEVIRDLADAYERGAGEEDDALKAGIGRLIAKSLRQQLAVPTGLAAGGVIGPSPCRCGAQDEHDHAPACAEGEHRG